MNNNLSAIWNEVLTLMEEGSRRLQYGLNHQTSIYKRQYNFVTVPSSISQDMVDRRYSELIKMPPSRLGGRAMN